MNKEVLNEPVFVEEIVNIIKSEKYIEELCIHIRIF